MPILRTSVFVLVFLLGCGAPRAASVVDTPYTVATWQGARAGALSLTFDDACPGQFTILVPLMNKYDFKATFFVDLGNLRNFNTPWDNIRRAAVAGHEIASHSVTHSKFSTLTESQQEAELRNSRDTIDKQIPSQKVLTFAYPNCVRGKEALVARYYMAARTCNENRIEPSNPANMLRINSFSYGGSVSAQTLNGTADASIAQKGWGTILIHGIDNAGGYNPVKSSMLKTHFDYLQTRKNQIWVATFADVARYIRERQSVSLKQIRRTSDSLVVKLSDTLPDGTYNVPLTILRPLPAGWNTCFVSQNGRALKDSIVTVNSKRQVMFDAVPDGGDIVISTKSTVAAQRWISADSPDKATLSNVHGKLRISLPQASSGDVQLLVFDLQGVQRAVAPAIRADDGYDVDLPEIGAGIYGAKISINGVIHGASFTLHLH